MRERRSASEWRKLVERFEATSGITQRAFAQKHGLNEASFKNWLYRIRRQRREQALVHVASHSPHFVEVKPESHPLPTMSKMSLFIGESLILEFSQRPDVSYLASLLQALQSS